MKLKLTFSVSVGEEKVVLVGVSRGGQGGVVCLNMSPLTFYPIFLAIVSCNILLALCSTILCFKSDAGIMH